MSVRLTVEPWMSNYVDQCEIMDFFFIFKLSLLLGVVMTQSTTDLVRSRISSGNDANAAGDTYFAYVGFFSYSGSPICGCSIIHQRWALTAGHCVRYNFVDPLVTFGTYYHFGADGISYAVEIIYRHPGFQQLPTVVTDDVAIIRTVNPIKFTNKIRPIPLNRDVNANYENQIATICGWGATQNETVSHHLLYGNIDIMSIDDCRAETGYAVNNWIHMCGSNPTFNQQACLGDSGGPVVINFRQVGLVSMLRNYEGPCNGTGITVLAKVSAFVPWIEGIMENVYNEVLQ